METKMVKFEIGKVLAVVVTIVVVALVAGTMLKSAYFQGNTGLEIGLNRLEHAQLVDCTELTLEQAEAFFERELTREEYAIVQACVDKLSPIQFDLNKDLLEENTATVPTPIELDEKDIKEEATVPTPIELDEKDTKEEVTVPTPIELDEKDTKEEATVPTPIELDEKNTK